MSNCNVLPPFLDVNLKKVIDMYTGPIWILWSWKFEQLSALSSIILETEKTGQKAKIDKKELLTGFVNLIGSSKIEHIPDP